MRIRHHRRAVWIIAVVAGCGDQVQLEDAPPSPDGPFRPDSGQPDAAIDAGVPGRAMIHVTSEPGSVLGGQPIHGAAIAVVEPGTDSVVLAETDATGAAAITVVPHSRVWVDVEAPRAHLYLIEDVSPNDVIAVGGRPMTGTPSVDGTLEVIYKPLPGPHTYLFQDANAIPCGDRGVETSPGHILFTWSTGCAAPAREVEITAFDTTTGAAAGYLRIPGVSPAITGTLDATAIGWDPTGVPYKAAYAGLDGVDFAASRVFSNASWQSVEVSAALVDGVATVARLDASLPAPVVIMTELHHGPRAKQFGDDPVPAQLGNLAIDPTSVLPFISPPTYSPSTQTLAWTRTTAGVEPQLVTTTFVDHDHLWTVYAPVTGDSLVIPEVPDALTTAIDVPATPALAVNVALVHADGSSYHDLLKDIDYHRAELDAEPYRWGARSRWSVGY